MKEHTLKCKQLFEYQHILLIETPGGQSSNLYLNVVHFLMPVLIRHLQQLKTVVFLHCCLINAVLLKEIAMVSKKIILIKV
jgi:hypothetical protein